MELQAAAAVLEELAAVSEARDGRIVLSLDGPIASLRIDNPRVRNAMTVPMMVELARAVVALAAWDGAALIVHASPSAAFCAGGHLKDVNAVIDRPERAKAMALAMGTVLDALLALPVTSVAAIDGLAVGGGAELVTATDHRVLGDDGRIHFVHGRLGIAPGWGGTGRLVAHVGRSAALRILHDASPITDRRDGLVQSCGPTAEAAARELLAPVLALPTAAARALKRQVTAARPSRDLDREADAFAAVWGGADHRAALARLSRHTR